MQTGIELIAEERARQIADDWTAAHDDRHTCGELVKAAMCYAETGCLLATGYSTSHVRTYILNDHEAPHWPWNHWDFKPKSARKDLIRAGALIAAEIDRLNRRATIENSLPE